MKEKRNLTEKYKKRVKRKPINQKKITGHPHEFYNSCNLQQTLYSTFVERGQTENCNEFIKNGSF